MTTTFSSSHLVVSSANRKCQASVTFCLLVAKIDFNSIFSGRPRSRQRTKRRQCLHHHRHGGFGQTKVKRSSKRVLRDPFETSLLQLQSSDNREKSSKQRKKKKKILLFLSFVTYRHEAQQRAVLARCHREDRIRSHVLRHESSAFLPQDRNGIPFA